MFSPLKPLLPLLLTTALVACGGGSGNGGSSTPTNSSSTVSSSSSSISVSSSSSSVSSSSSISVSSSSSSVSSSSSAVSSSSSLSSSSADSSASSASSAKESLYTLVDFPVGVAVNAGYENRSFLSMPEKQQTIKQHFSQLTAGNIMKMSYLHPAENDYNFTQADALVNWAKSNGLSVHGHTFIWHADYQVPNWMKSYTGDFEAMLNTHVTTIADHFKDDVVSWDVVNEAIDETQASCYRNSLFYQKLQKKFIENAFRAAHAADPDADLYYNDYNTEGTTPAKLTCLLALIDDLQSKDVPITGVGFQMHVQIDYPSTSAISSAFKAIVDRGLKVKVTELDVPVNNPYTGKNDFPQFTTFDATAQAKQKARYKAIAQAYLDTVPAAQRGGFTVWGLWDGDSWILTFDKYKNVDDWPLLFSGPANGPYVVKPAFDGVAEAFLGM